MYFFPFLYEYILEDVISTYPSASEMIRKWEDSVSIEVLCELNVWPHLQHVASDVISTAFGSSYEEGGRVFQLQNELGDLTMRVIQSVYIPGWR